MLCVFKIGQWVLRVTTKQTGDEVAQMIKDGKEIEISDYEMFNPGPNGEHRFYDVRPGDWSAPTVFEEPARAIDLPANLVVKTAKGDPLLDAKKNPLTPTDLNAKGRKIVGYVLHDSAGNVLTNGRASLTNAAGQGITPQFAKDNALMVGGHRFHVRVLHEVNKNRIRGFVAYCHMLDAASRVPETRVVELEDLKFELPAVP
ncbi:hypothetical protein IT411_01055 [Candidatus Peregrinibacteria bacterium]|nr:hypothetical protein [Candidatus Peregrinibacteria bacterium]